MSFRRPKSSRSKIRSAAEPRSEPEPEPEVELEPEFEPRPDAGTTIRGRNRRSGPRPLPSGAGSSGSNCGLARTSSKLTQGITSLFTKRKLDDETIEDLEDLLIQADLGVDTAARIVESAEKDPLQQRYNGRGGARRARRGSGEDPGARWLLRSFWTSARKPHVILVVGVNGVGKTTTIGKMARRFSLDGKRVMLAAGDTFRAAAIDQLKIWGERTGARGDCPSAWGRRRRSRL